MSDAANGLPAGSTDGGDAGDNRATIQPPAGDGSNAGGNNWLDGLQDEGNRRFVEAKQFDSLDAAVKSQRELEGKLAQSLVMPGEEATQEDWDKFYQKAGRPENAEGYTFTIDRDNLPENFPYDETAAANFKAKALEAGISQKQAALLHDWFVDNQAGLFTEQTEKQQKRSEDTTRELVSKWGDLDTEAYKEQSMLADRAMRGLGVKDAFIEHGIMSKEGVIYNTQIALAMAKLGAENYAEDALHGNGEVLSSNPFAEGSRNLTEQGQLVRNDPKRAAGLIRAAGGDPKKYGL